MKNPKEWFLRPRHRTQSLQDCAPFLEDCKLKKRASHVGFMWRKIKTPRVEKQDAPGRSQEAPQKLSRARARATARPVP